MESGASRPSGWYCNLLPYDFLCRVWDSGNNGLKIVHTGSHDVVRNNTWWNGHRVRRDSLFLWENLSFSGTISVSGAGYAGLSRLFLPVPLAFPDARDTATNPADYFIGLDNPGSGQGYCPPASGSPSGEWRRFGGLCVCFFQRIKADNISHPVVPGSVRDHLEEIGIPKGRIHTRSWIDNRDAIVIKKRCSLNPLAEKGKVRKRDCVDSNRVWSVLVISSQNVPFRLIRRMWICTELTSRSAADR